MKKTCTTAFLASVVLLLAVPAAGQAQLSTSGKTQLGINGFGTFTENTQRLISTLSITQFVSEGLELGADLTLQTDFEDASGFAFGRARYNFVGQSMTVPFLSLGVGKELSANTNALFSGGVGLRHFVSEDVSLNAETSTSWSFVNSNLTWSEAVMLNFGVSVYFGG